MHYVFTPLVAFLPNGPQNAIRGRFEHVECYGDDLAYTEQMDATRGKARPGTPCGDYLMQLPATLLRSTSNRRACLIPNFLQSLYRAR